MKEVNNLFFEFLNKPEHSPSNGMFSNTKKRKSIETTIEEQKKQRNRERVRRCRKKKQDRLSYLEQRNLQLEEENQELKDGKNPAGKVWTLGIEQPLEIQRKV